MRSNGGLDVATLLGHGECAQLLCHRVGGVRLVERAAEGDNVLRRIRPDGLCPTRRCPGGFELGRLVVKRARREWLCSREIRARPVGENVSARALRGPLRGPDRCSFLKTPQELTCRGMCPDVPLIIRIFGAASATRHARVDVIIVGGRVDGLLSALEACVAPNPHLGGGQVVRFDDVKYASPTSRCSPNAEPPQARSCADLDPSRAHLDSRFDGMGRLRPASRERG